MPSGLWVTMPWGGGHAMPLQREGGGEGASALRAGDRGCPGAGQEGLGLGDCPPAQGQGWEMNSAMDGAKKHRVCASRA